VPALPDTAVDESLALPPGTIVHPAWPTTTRRAEPGEEEHAVREERILAALDSWLARLTTSELDATVAAVLAADGRSTGEPAEVANARRRQEQLRLELDRMLAAIRAGMDPTLAAAQTRSIQADLAAAEKVVRRAQPTDSRLTPLTEKDVRNALGEAESLIKLLGGADRTDRTALYRPWASACATKRSCNRAGTSPGPVAANT